MPALRDAYPHSFLPERHLGPLARDFVMARNAVRRLARATAFSPDDAELRTIATEAGDLLQERTLAVEAEQHARMMRPPGR